MGGLDHSQSVVSIARQKLLKDSMDAYLKVELRRQQNEALEMHRNCSTGIDKMFDKMEQVRLVVFFDIKTIFETLTL